MANKEDFFLDILKKSPTQIITNSKVEITIFEELYKLIPPLTSEEYEKLEKSLLKEGCREALILWKKENDYILVDGHNRYEICKKHNIAFNTQIRTFLNIEDVKDWMINNQLGKRNITEEVKSYLRGWQYKTEKLKQGGSGNNQFSKVENLTTLQKTSEKLAQEHKVSEKTIRNDEKFVKNLDVFVGDDVDLKWKILNKEVLISKSDLEKIANGEDNQIEKIRQELKERGKVTLPNTKLVTEKEKKISMLFALFLKTRNPELIGEISAMMKEMV